jgi:spore coat polysaccharide biosynthesis protein SpsF
MVSTNSVLRNSSIREITKMNVIAIIQARMGSSRFPGKVMKMLPGGCTVLGVLIYRLCAAKTVNRIVVATTLKKEDKDIVNFCFNKGVICHKGSEDDVLDRVYQAARAYSANIIVDITADCPLVDPAHVDYIVNELLNNNSSYQRGKYIPLDYVSNCIERDWPDGLDIQAYTIEALEKVWRSKKSVRQHVGWNIPQQADDHGFNIRQVFAPKKFHKPHWGLTLDEPADYDLIKYLFIEGILAFGNHLFPIEHILNYIISRPELLKINEKVARKTPGEG